MLSSMLFRERKSVRYSRGFLEFATPSLHK
nr:MAG TPA: hypothetical protein [Caudoviricetes sp.]